MRGEPIGFLQTFSKIFAINDYDDFAEQPVSRSISYFFKLMIIGTILLFLFSIPAVTRFSEKFDNSLSKFDYLTISLNYSMKEPVVLMSGDNYKQVSIDLNSNVTSINKGKLLITNHSIIKKSWLGSEVINTTGYSNVIEHQIKYKKFLIGILAFMLPSLVVIAYLCFSIKFAAMILLISFLTFVVARVIRFEIDYKDCFNCTLYPFTISILAAMILFPYHIQFYFIRAEWIAYLISIILMLLGLQSAGYFVKKPERRDKLIRKSYVELR